MKNLVKEPRMVYGARGWRDGHQIRIVAAVDSIAEFSRVTGVTRSDASVYGSETGNANEIVAARAVPRTAIYREDEYGYGPFRTDDGRRITVKLAATIEEPKAG